MRKKIYKSTTELSEVMLGLINSGTDVKITVTGNSMRPMLRHRRDTVVLTLCDANTLKKGDLPLYMREDGSYILHRIIKVNDETFDCCGDNQWSVEKNVPKENVLAVVKEFTRRGKVYNAKNKLYRFYVALWMLVLPLRKHIFNVWSVLVKAVKPNKK